MKLIDLLIQELPKRGGWPDGAVECCRHYGTNSIDFYDETGNWDDDCYLKYGKDFAKDCIYEETSGSHRLQSISRSEYESVLAASQKPAWSGEGVPPVGCECEWRDSNVGWLPVKIKYISEQIVVIESPTNLCGVQELTEIAKDIICDKPQFRPLRTKAERKRDIAAQALCNSCGGTGKVDEDLGFGVMWFDIYDAIAAGKIPGVKLDD